MTCDVTSHVYSSLTTTNYFALSSIRFFSNAVNSLHLFKGGDRYGQKESKENS